MNKSEIIAAIAEATGQSKRDAAEFVDTLLDEISSSLERGEKVELTGFGKFEVRSLSARLGRNPQTGESIPIPARRSPAFKAGSVLKRAVALSEPDDET